MPNCAPVTAKETMRFMENPHYQRLKPFIPTIIARTRNTVFIPAEDWHHHANRFYAAHDEQLLTITKRHWFPCRPA